MDDKSIVVGDKINDYIDYNNINKDNELINIPKELKC